MASIRELSDSSICLLPRFTENALRERNDSALRYSANRSVVGLFRSGLGTQFGFVSRHIFFWAVGGSKPFIRR
jgi:hypothetical protein